jgi:hypothetical protein
MLEAVQDSLQSSTAGNKMPAQTFILTQGRIDRNSTEFASYQRIYASVFQRISK